MTVISAPQTGPNAEAAGLTRRAWWAVADGLAAAERVLTKLRHDLCGLAVGWRVHRGAADAATALGLLLAFQVAMIWVGMYLGLVVGKEETAAQASILIFPVTTISNVFVPTSGMPGWLRAVAYWNPVSAVAAAVRQLFGSPAAPANGAWPLEHPIAASLGWTALLLIVFVPLCTARYARPPA